VFQLEFKELVLELLQVLVQRLQLPLYLLQKSNWLEYTTPGLAGLIRVTLGVRVGVLHVLKWLGFLPL
jgi:hypothetical protein